MLHLGRNRVSELKIWILLFYPGEKPGELVCLRIPAFYIMVSTQK